MMSEQTRGDEATRRLPFDRLHTWIWWDYPNTHTINWTPLTEQELASNLTRLDEAWQPGNRPIQMYIQVPYCESFCYYCGYTRLNYPTQTQSSFDRYVDYLIKEVDFYLSKRYVQTAPFTALTIGGGSPSTLPPRTLDRLFRHLAENVPGYASIERTFTGEPRSLRRPETLQLVKDYDWTRVTFGVESLTPELRREVGRLATKEDVDAVFDGLERVRYAGEVNFDVMYNLPGEDFQRFVADLTNLIEHYEPDSLDGFSTVYTPYSPMWKLIASGRRSQPAPVADLIRMREHFYDFLSDRGYNNVLTITFSKLEAPSHFYRGVYGLEDVIPVGISARGNVMNMSTKNPTQLETWMENIDRRGVSTTNMQLIGKARDFIRTMVMFPQLKVLPKQDLERYRDVAEWSDLVAVLRQHLRDGLVEDKGDRYELTRSGVVWYTNLQADYVEGTLTTEGRDLMRATSYGIAHFDTGLRIPNPEFDFNHATHPEAAAPTGFN